MLVNHRVGRFWCTGVKWLLTFKTPAELWIHFEKSHQNKKRSKKERREACDIRRLGLFYMWFDFLADSERRRHFGRHVTFCRVVYFKCDSFKNPLLTHEDARKKTTEFKKKIKHMEIEHSQKLSCEEAIECYMSFDTSTELDNHKKEKHEKKSRIRQTPTLSTDANSRTNC